MGASYIPVIKIQMVYDGKTSELSPFFPLDSTDYKRVSKTITELLEKQRNTITATVKPPSSTAKPDNR